MKKVSSNICSCPVCKKGMVIASYPNTDEPYWGKLIEGIVCDKCKTEFKKIVLDDKKKNCVAYEVENNCKI